MKKMTCMTLLALPALIAGAAEPLKLSGTSLSAGRGSLRTTDKNIPERNVEPKKDEDMGTVTTVVFSGPQSGWGITKTATPYYSAEGKYLGMLPGGTLFDYSAVKTSSKNMVLEAKVRQDGDWTGPFLLDGTSLAIFEGKPDNINPQTIADLTGYFSITSKLAERKDALEKAGYEKSPGFEAARRAQERYSESIRQAAELSAQADKATGSAKSKLDDQLRALKYEQVRIKAEADKEAAGYKAWKDANPLPPETLRDDPEIAALEQQLAPLKAKIGALAVED